MRLYLVRHGQTQANAEHRYLGSLDPELTETGREQAAALRLELPQAIDAIVADPTARQVARDYLPFCAIVPLLGVPAWQLDGIFLGAVRGRSLRNAAIVATAAYIGLDLLLRESGMGNAGVWWAFLAMYVLRALSLAPGMRGLVEDSRPKTA